MLTFQNEYTFIYSFLPYNQTTINSMKLVNNAAERLAKKLQELNIDELNISAYNKNYFSNYLNNLRAGLQSAAYLIWLSLINSSVNESDFVLLDYGGGSGLLSLLAKEMKIGTVIYNDIYDVSCRDAETLAIAIGNKADRYIQGDISDVLDALSAQNISCDAIISNEVIEHIYNIEIFMKTIPLLLNKQGKIVMSTTANPYNPIRNKQTRKKHLEYEYSDRKPKFGHKERDSLKSYFEIRRLIIAENFPSLTEEEISLLATNTRGLIKQDIIAAIKKYVENGEVPVRIDDPTNTCDPYTGNWAEHLMNPYMLKSILEQSNCKVEIVGGYYGHSKKLFNNLIRSSLNFLVAFFNQKNLFITPSYIIYAIKNY